MKRSKSLLTCFILLLVAFLTSCDLSKPIYPTAITNTQPAIIKDFDCQASISPWDISWLLSENAITISRIDNILTGTGLSGYGSTILQSAIDYQVNPAFALAMFHKEANFAAPGTRANKNNNPGNIIATGECRGKPAGSSCSGVYGEVSTDGRFGVYPDMSAGIKAYFQLLNREYAPGSKRNCTDIPCIIQAYCPPSDCDTQKYVDQVTEWGKDYQCQLYAINTVPAPSPTPTRAPTIEINTVNPPQIISLTPPSPQPVGVCVFAHIKTDWDQNLGAIRIKFGQEEWQDIAGVEFDKVLCTIDYEPGIYKLLVESRAKNDMNWSSPALSEIDYELKSINDFFPGQVVVYGTARQVFYARIGLDIYIIRAKEGQRWLVPNIETAEALGIPGDLQGNMWNLSEDDLLLTPRGPDVPDIKKDPEKFWAFRNEFFLPSTPLNYLSTIIITPIAIP